MPRLGYETPCQPVRRSPSERDRFLFIIKFSAFVVAVALFGGFYLLSSGTSRDSGRPAAAVTSAPPSSPVRVAQPEVRTMTSHIAPPPAEPAEPVEQVEPAKPSRAPAPPPASTPAPPPAPAPGRRFAVVGKSCPRPGMYSITSRYWPVVCRGGIWEPIDPEGN